jgi:hypothetical protein
MSRWSYTSYLLHHVADVYAPEVTEISLPDAILSTYVAPLEATTIAVAEREHDVMPP